MDEYAHGQVRAVTHNDVATTDIDTIVAAVRRALDATAGRPTTQPDEARHLQGV
jgi:hypothetical protein